MSSRQDFKKPGYHVSKSWGCDCFRSVLSRSSGCVCVWAVWIDVKPLSPFFQYCRGLEYDSEVSNQRRRFWCHSDMIPGRWNHVPAIWLRLTWWPCWNIGHEGWIFFSSCLLYHHETRNIFFHDFGTWCLSFCTSVWEVSLPHPTVNCLEVRHRRCHGSMSSRPPS